MTAAAELDPTDPVLRQVFTEARTFSAWQNRPVEDRLLEEAWALARMGPTSANIQPLRIAFAKSPEAKERLRPALSPGNVDKTMAAPVTAILGHAPKFYEELPRLFPMRDLRPVFAGDPALAERSGVQSATLQAAYFLLAARAVGLDTGPMTGFDPAKADAAFFPDGEVRSFMLINLGYGDRGKLFPRLPRLSFAEVASIL